MSYVAGVDVSSIQGVIDWAKVAAHGVRFAWLKCTEGNEPARNDSRFAANLQGCRDNGIAAGAYHFAYPLPPGAPGRSPVEQAQRAFEACDGLGMGPGELPPALDAEWPEVGDGGKWGVTAASMSAWLHEYCVEVEVLWGRKPIIYTYPFYWKAMASAADVSWAAAYDLWIANYMHIEKDELPPDAAPIIPPPWSDWTGWQWSADRGVRVPGIAVDVDRNVVRDLGRLVLPAVERPVASGVCGPAAITETARK